MDIEAKLPNPAGSAQYDPKQMDEHPIYGDLYSNQGEAQYIRDRRVQSKAEMDNRLMS
tara:strand:+ start:67 stop:240 length:174 start_codon:yes stop_codon:yes gene_type:complete